MSAEALHRLAGGERPGDRLLHSCRLQWADEEAFGEEAVLELFRAAPLDLDDATLVETATAAALIGAEGALVADLYDRRVGRLWRLGAGVLPAAEPSIAVAFDPDLRQERGGVYLRGEDHPELAPAALDAVHAAGQAFIKPAGTPLHRARAFPVRAFGDGERAAALFAVYHVTGGLVRQSGFADAIALIEGDAARFVRDQPPASERTRL